MKKCLVLLMAASLAACGGGGSSDNKGAAAASAAPASSPTTPASAPAGASNSVASKPCAGGAFTTDASQVCTDANGNLVTAYVYLQPTTIVPDGTVISADTTWSQNGSPYYIAGTVQVAKGVTLTVGDNAIVEGLKPVPCNADCIGKIPTKGIINVAGALNVGSKYQAQLLGVTVSNLSTQIGGGTVNIQQTLMEDAFVQISNVAPFSMTNSLAYRLNVTPIVRAGVMTYQAGTNGYPSFRNATLKYNTFIDSAAFAFDPTVTLQNNLFINMVDPLVLINAFPANQSTMGIAQKNSFLFKKDSPNANRMVIESHGTYDPASVHTLDFSNNFWGVTDSTTIQARVADSTNTSNPQLPNVIKYAPAAQVEDPSTPVDPQRSTPNI